MTTATCEDPNEARTEQRLLEPIIKDHQGFDPEKMKQGMIKEMTSMVTKECLKKSPSKKQQRKKRGTSLDQSGSIATKEMKSDHASSASATTK